MDYNTPAQNLPMTGPPDAWTWILVIAVMLVAGILIRRAAR